MEWEEDSVYGIIRGEKERGRKEGEGILPFLFFFSFFASFVWVLWWNLYLGLEYSGAVRYGFRRFGGRR